MRGGILTLQIKVQPKASRCAVLDERDGYYRLSLTAPPVDGEANEALVKFLAKLLGLKRQNVVLAGGRQSRHKTLHLIGADFEAVHSALERAIAGS